MNFTNLLKSTIRLVDTYDLKRNPGQTSVSVGPEDRRQSTSGLWFLLATSLLRYLHVQDAREPMGYHAIEPFYESLPTPLQVFSLEDVKYMVNLLSKEFELKFHDSKVHRIKSATSLIEKRSYGFRCKLTPTGFTAINLSYTADELLYGDQIAKQIEKALEFGDFERYVEYADKLLNIIIQQSYEIIALIENSGKQEIREHYYDKREAYLDTLAHITDTAKAIGEGLKSAETEELLDRFITKHPEKSHYEHILYLKIEQINGALLNFRNSLSKFVKEFYSQSENIAPIVDFHAISKAIATGKIPMESQEAIVSLFGLWGSESSHVSPDYDLFDPIVVAEKRLVSRPSFNKEQGDEVRDSLQTYIDANLGDIAASIETRGYFSVSEAIVSEVVECQQIEDFVALIGICLSPSDQMSSLGELVVCVDNGEMSVAELGDYELSFSNLILKKK